MEPRQSKKNKKTKKKPVQEAPTTSSEPVQQKQRKQSTTQSIGESSDKQQKTAWGKGSPFKQSPTPGTSGESVRERQEDTDKTHRGGDHGHQQPQSAWGKGTPFSKTASGSGEPSHQQPQSVWGRGKSMKQSQSTVGISETLQQKQGGPESKQQQAQSAWARGKPMKQSQSAGGISETAYQKQGERGRPEQYKESQQPQNVWARGHSFKQSHTTTGPEQLQQRQIVEQAHSSKVQVEKPKDAPRPSGSGTASMARHDDADYTKFNEGSLKLVDSRIKRDRIRVATNYFRLRLTNVGMVVYHYDVAFTPEKPVYLLRPAWEKFNQMKFPGVYTVFDGRKNAYSKGPLMGNKTLTDTVTVLNSERNKDKDFVITITEVRQISFATLENYRGTTVKSTEAEITVLDNILREWPSRTLVPGGKNFFSEHSNPLSDVLEIRQGIFQSAILGSKLLLNFDIAHKVFYRNISVVNVYEYFQRKKFSNSMNELNSFLRKVKVEYNPLDKNRGPQVYVFNEFVDNARNQKFTVNDSKISVEQYFLQKMNYRLKYPEYPLLWVGPKTATIYLPMELCRIAKNQVNNSELEPQEQREMLKMTTFNARERKTLTERIFRNTDFTNPVMKEFGISLSTEMEHVEGHVLKPPILQTQKSIKTQNGVWDNVDFYKAKSLKKWCILNLDKYANKEKIINLQNLIRKIGHECGMLVENPERSPEVVFPSTDKLRKVFSGLKGMDIVFVVISDKKEDYSKVKTICEIEKGILTQCIKRRTIDQDHRKISTTIKNILLKVNAKLGGENQTLEKSSVPESLNGYVMIVGADVTHPRPGSKMPSIAAVAVSYDSNACKYAISHRVQFNEIIKNFEEIMRFHIKQFQKIRGAYPDKIMYFRDGVSEGQFKYILLEEVKALEKACDKLCKPKLTVLVVQKRHHTKLYPASDSSGIGKNFNVPVGTCVDTEIVSPKNLDFYLVSHASILGTARPTRYRLLRNDSQFSDYELEKLCYYLCYLCSRCNRSISYPSPTYYAHLGAFRAKSYLEEIIRPTDPIDVEKIQSKLKDEISPTYPMFFV